MIFAPVKMYDASKPRVAIPKDGKVVAGYIGGDTPHVWTIGEWQKFNGLKKLPIYVRDNPASHNGTDDAFEALRKLYILGVPKGSPVALDMETAVSSVYVMGFHQVMKWAGYRLWVYGSLNFVTGNPRCDGYWVAHYDDKAKFDPDVKEAAKQYRRGSDWDTSIVKWWQYTYRLKKW